VNDPLRTRSAPVVLAATDPANPFGAALAWPVSAGRPSRTAGAHVVLVDGEPALWVERGGRRLVTFPVAAATDRWVGGLLQLVDDGRVARLVVEQIDGESAAVSPLAVVLRGSGFRDGYRGLVYGK
jgi:ATP-dependent Lhr-like helicase